MVDMILTGFFWVVMAVLVGGGSLTLWFHD